MLIGNLKDGGGKNGERAEENGRKHTQNGKKKGLKKKTIFCVLNREGS